MLLVVSLHYAYMFLVGDHVFPSLGYGADWIGGQSGMFVFGNSSPRVKWILTAFEGRDLAHFSTRSVFAIPSTA